MKTQNGKSVLGLSLVTAMLLGSSAYAGKIITDADVNNIVLTKDKQFGFGGWNFENIDVRIVDVSDFSGNVGTFNTVTGVYTTMGADMSFESDIKNEADVIVGHLHGKDWPVGEPSGIKIINDDANVKVPKPVNCIMTSSYLGDLDDSGTTFYLDSATPKPVLCSSPFQTHKRFKINMLPSTVEGIAPGSYGKPVDLVFNLDPTDASTESVRYQVLQKINNYTDVRLDGYKMEVLDANGAKNAALTLSIGEGEDTTNDPATNIWSDDELANFSHGLWGPIDTHFTTPGFFDEVRAYYPAALADPQTISYAGDMVGGNYQDIFGNWLPSIWAPVGIFHDDDNNPETDGALRAFWGVPPGAAEGTLPAWHKGFVDNWAEPTTAELIGWTGALYEEETIEDVLNLGLNYIVEVGENAKLGNSFTLRVTPHVALDQTVPIYVDIDAPTDYPFSKGIVGILPEPRFTVGDTLTVGVADHDLNTDPAKAETVTVKVANDAGVSQSVVLTETDVDTSRFSAEVLTGDNGIAASQGTVITVTYVDERYGAEDAVETLTASTTAVAADTPPAELPVYIPSSSGGGCTYNPNSKNFDITFLFMMALGLLYPFRRRFLK